MPDGTEKDVAGTSQDGSVQELTSPESGQHDAVQPEADELVPKKAFLARVGEESEKRRKAEDDARIEREARIRAEAERDAARQAPVAVATRKPRYTLEQLQDAVDAAQISQKEMWRIWEQQNDERITEAATIKAREVFNEAATVNRIQGKRNAYGRLVPGWNTPGTEANRKAESAFLDLLADGLPRTAATEVLALERAFGSIDTLARSTRSEDITQQERPVSNEGGSSNGVKPSNGVKGDVLKYLSAAERASYDLLVNQKRMTWEEVREQVEWSLKQDINPKLRDQMLARVK